MVMLIVSGTFFYRPGGCLCISAYVRMCVALLPVYLRHLIAAALIVSRCIDRPVFRYSVPYGHGDQRFFRLSREFSLAFQQRLIDRDILMESHRPACRHDNTGDQRRRRVCSIVRGSSRVSLSTYCVSVDPIGNTSFVLGSLQQITKNQTLLRVGGLVTQES